MFILVACQWARFVERFVALITNELTFAFWILFHVRSLVRWRLAEWLMLDGRIAVMIIAIVHLVFPRPIVRCRTETFAWFHWHDRIACHFWCHLYESFHRYETQCRVRNHIWWIMRQRFSTQIHHFIRWKQSRSVTRWARWRRMRWGFLFNWQIQRLIVQHRTAAATVCRR